MSDGVFKAPKSKKPSSEFGVDAAEVEDEVATQIVSPLPKKRRTAEDFIMFCNFILEYENYEAQKQEELRTKTNSPLGSTGSSTESIKSEGTSSCVMSLEETKPPDLVPSMMKRQMCHLASTSQSLPKNKWPPDGFHGSTSLSDDDSWDLVTCYCLKPFAGRPMIECSECLTWLHLSCAKIRKANIPEEFICQRCRDAKLTTRRSQRVRNEKRRISA